jgi:hypothetical protein
MFRINFLLNNSSRVKNMLIILLASEIGREELSRGNRTNWKDWGKSKSSKKEEHGI